MIHSLHEVVTQIPSRAWYGLAFGLVATLIGGYLLYGELKALLTDADSPVTYSDDPQSLTVGRRAIAWFGGIVSFLGGIVFLYGSLTSIYRCVALSDPIYPF